jgi:hypothetical protein
LTNTDEFVRTVTEKLFIYALGRGLEHTDAPEVRRIGRDLADNEHRWSSLILGIVRSPQFQMRTALEPQHAAPTGTTASAAAAR